MNMKLDARGMVCPEPILEAEKSIKELAPGDIMLVLATDPAAPIDFEVWCLHRGHRYLGSEESGEWLEIKLEKSSPKPGE